MQAHNFPNDASKFVYVRTYARWIEELKRRESWDETVDRYIGFLEKHCGDRVPWAVFQKARDYILDFQVMGSMRAMWAAGEAAEAEPMAIYNCAAVKVDCPEAFGEILYALMNGTGCGFRVLKEDVDQLPTVPFGRNHEVQYLGIEDSKAGWASSTVHLIKSLYEGRSLTFNYSSIRPRGSRLKTMGGRASGPGPLIKLHEFIRNTFDNAWGRKLTPLECHDICCMIGEIVVVGGVRRSAEISLSDLHDPDMRGAKSGEWPVHRAMANNSAVYFEKPSREDFDAEWNALKESGSGERGFFNLESARLRAPRRRDASKLEVTNPCSEIVLRSGQLCNLSEVIVKADDTMETLLDKVQIATWLGAMQATFTDFKYVRPLWKENCEEERLLGVSLTGQFDAPHLMTHENLRILKHEAVSTAAEAAKLLGINVPAAVTTVKPSGSVSILCDSASGQHPRFAQYYTRRFRISASDPLFKMMIDQGVPFVPEVGQESLPDEEITTWVCEFPVAAPTGALTRNEVSAINQLEHYHMLMTSWCEHSASVTIYVGEDEWGTVGDWVYKHWDTINGVSFLPRTDHVYELAPYSDLTEAEYLEAKARFPKIDYSKLSLFEVYDQTEGSKSYACAGNSCELV